VTTSLKLTAYTSDRISKISIFDELMSKNLAALITYYLTTLYAFTASK